MNTFFCELPSRSVRSVSTRSAEPRSLYHSFDTLRAEVDKAFLSLLNPGYQNGSGSQRTQRSVQPLVNVWEEPEAFVVESEIPGLTSSDIEVEVVANELILRGERKPRQVESGEIRHSEIPCGQFERRLKLPTEINAERVEATFQSGVLTVRLPKADAVKPRRIPVSS